MQILAFKTIVVTDESNIARSTPVAVVTRLVRRMIERDGSTPAILNRLPATITRRTVLPLKPFTAARPERRTDPVPGACRRGSCGASRQQRRHDGPEAAPNSDATSDVAAPPSRRGNAQRTIRRIHASRETTVNVN